MPYCDHCDRFLNAIDNKAAEPDETVCVRCTGEITA